MIRIAFVFFSLFVTQIGFGQSKIDSVLYKKILIMFDEDQKWRYEYNKITSEKKSQYDEETINKNWAKTDSLNLMSAKEIVNKVGFPGYHLVGKEGSNKFWAIIQHCDDDLAFQQKTLLLMDAQVKKQNASSENNALLRDRILVSSGKKQLYGTQVRYNRDTKTSEPFPIEDPANVNRRRKTVGLSTLEEYLELFKKKN